MSTVYKHYVHATLQLNENPSIVNRRRVSYCTDLTPRIVINQINWSGHSGYSVISSTLLPSDNTIHFIVDESVWFLLNFSLQ